MTDEQIMQRIMDKDPTVYNDLYDKLYRKLFLFAKSLIDDPEEARDIVAESFIKLWAQNSHFSNMLHLQGYFYAIIKNACIDYLRKNKLRIKIESQLLRAGTISENVIERKYQEAELVEILYERINQLPDRMQQVFKLTYLDGYSRTEVAQMLNLSENTIRNTNAAAMKAIRLTLGVEQLVVLFFLAMLFLMAACS
jgi:RNA polymerase sigma-70 factor (ECF subfamily)